VNAGWLVFGDAGTVFAEAGKLMNYDGGFMTGLKGRLLEFADYQVDYRICGDKFVPGYFNTQYEYEPVDLKTLSTGGISGYHGALGYDILSLGRFDLEYENYVYADSGKNDPFLAATLEVNDIAGMNGTVYDEQTRFQSISASGEQYATLECSGEIPLTMIGIGFPGLAQVTLRRDYYGPKEFIDTQAIGYVLPLVF
jgi:hypothetical protein